MILLLIHLTRRLLRAKHRSDVLHTALIAFFIMPGAIPLTSQYHTDFSSSTPLEVLYETERSSCKDTVMWAGIRRNVNGNPLVDQIMYGTMKLDGSIDNPVNVFPPANWNIFKAHPNVELLQIEKGDGSCNGYMMAISHTDDGVNYNLHIMRLNEAGQKICETAPLPASTTSDYINEMILDTDGTVVLVGTMDHGTSTELLLMRIDSSCTILNVARHAMEVNDVPMNAVGHSINPYINPATPARYAVAGKAGIYSMLSLVDYGLNLVSTTAWDINDDQVNDEAAVDIFHQGNIYVTGRAQIDTTTQYTYFAEIDHSTPAPALLNFKMYALSGKSNLPTDMDIRNNLNGFVIGGMVINDSTTVNDFDPYLIKVDRAGNIDAATLQEGNHLHGRTLDVERMGALGYMIGGDIWDTPSSLNRSYFIANTDHSLATTMDCYDAIQDSIMMPEVRLLPVTTEEGPILDPHGGLILPLDSSAIRQKYCESPAVYDCDSIGLTAIIVYSHTGLSYTFSSASTTSSGTITATDWEITDYGGATIHTSTSDPMTYIFPSLDEYTIELVVEVVLADGTSCRDTTSIVLCADEVVHRTFDITHDISEDTSYLSLGDWAEAGFINSGGRYAVLGHYNDAVREEQNIYFSRFDKEGAVIRAPIREQLLPSGTDYRYDVVDMEERSNGEGNLRGYLALTNRTDDTGEMRFQLSWLNRSGYLSGVEDFFFITGTGYLASDMVVHGDTAAITGMVMPTGGTPEIFVMLYNHSTKTVICIQRIYISLGSNNATVIEHLGGHNYAIAGTKDNRAFYLEVDSSCRPDANALVKDVDNYFPSLDIPAKIIVGPSDTLVVGTTCDTSTHDVFAWDPNSGLSYLYELNARGSKVSDAQLLPSGNILVAGSTNLYHDGTWDASSASKAFIMEVDTDSVHWANIYESDDYEISHITAVDIDADNGVFAAGWSMPLTANVTEESRPYSANTLILKTDPRGRLFDCMCYEPIDVALEEVGPQENKFATDPTDIPYDPTPLQYNNYDILSIQYVCDRFCPSDCCIDHCQDTIIIASPVLGGGAYHAADIVMATGVSMMGSDSLDLKSGGSIHFEGGFEITPGDVMMSQIESCEACCEMDDPMTQLAWLASFPAIQTAMVERITLSDQCLYNIKPCGGVINHYYDCDGNYLCESGPGSLNDCPLGWNILNIEVIQGCP